MKTTNKNRKTVKNICFCAIFAALCAAATLISIPIPIGYINLGDMMVLTSGWCLGGVYGAVAAGVGSAIADFLLGYAVYAPATLIIKALVALFAVLVYTGVKKLFAKRNTKDIILRILSALIAECAMVLGYFIFESLVMGYGLAAAASIPLNCVQAFIGTLGASLIIGKIVYWFKKIGK